MVNGFVVVIFDTNASDRDYLKELMVVKVKTTTIHKFAENGVTEVWKLSERRFITTWSVSEKHTSQLPSNGILFIAPKNTLISSVLYIFMVTGQFLYVVTLTDFSNS